MKKWLKIILGMMIILILGIGGYIVSHSGFGVDRNNLPKFIQTDFVDLSKIYSISKFRSGAGHDFSGGGETCRSMKHYFTPQHTTEAEASFKANNGLPPKPDGKTDIAIYAPVDGKITDISEEHTPIGKQIAIVPDDAKQFKIRLFHIYPLDGIGFRSHLKAGQQIGVIGQYQGTDIAVQIGTLPWQETYISYFQVMPDSIFASYIARGAKSRDDFVVTKEYRDTHPLQCQTDASQSFIYPNDYNHDQDEVFLSGYQQADYGQQNQGNSTPQSGPQSTSSPPQNYGNNVPQSSQSSGQNSDNSQSQSGGY